MDPSTNSKENSIFQPVIDNPLHYLSSFRPPLTPMKHNKNKGQHLLPRSSLKQSYSKHLQKPYAKVRWSSPISTTREIQGQDTVYDNKSYASIIQSLDALTISASTDQGPLILEEIVQLPSFPQVLQEACYFDINCSSSIEQTGKPYQNQASNIVCLDIDDAFPMKAALSSSLFIPPAAFPKPSKLLPPSVLKMNLKYLAQVILPNSQVPLEPSDIISPLFFFSTPFSSQASPNVSQDTAYFIPSAFCSLQTPPKSLYKNNGSDQRQLIAKSSNSGIKRQAGCADLNTAPSKFIRLNKHTSPKKTKRRLPPEAKNFSNPYILGFYNSNLPNVDAQPVDSHPGNITNNTEALAIAALSLSTNTNEESDMSSLFGDGEAESRGHRQAPMTTKGTISRAQPQQHGQPAVGDLVVLRWTERLECFETLGQIGKMNQKTSEQLYALIQAINSKKTDPYLTPQVLGDSNLAKTLTQFRKKPWERRTRELADEISKSWRQLCRDVEES
ncbi:hypothetical protein CPB84DRAFT_1777126 [Gymnopilus junonius]|uniref:TFIIS N-terminal domain-containing protein n=1 Tax=Gymnopilus junonius TaxID=109634 RepID=A0A9P5NNY2_GYMJU|nr:hypothetical protein CPB84DRAFT_1777126 [Gymnopilus junonius]